MSLVLIRKDYSDVLFLLIYANDIIITDSSSVEIDHVINALSSSFVLKDLSSLYFLFYFFGIEASRSLNM